MAALPARAGSGRARTVIFACPFTHGYFLCAHGKTPFAHGNFARMGSNIYIALGILYGRLWLFVYIDYARHVYV